MTVLMCSKTKNKVSLCLTGFCDTARKRRKESVLKILGVMGSPRKGGNTHTLMKAVAEGASQAGAEMEICLLKGLVVKGNEVVALLDLAAVVQETTARAA